MKKVGDIETTTYKWQWRECEVCGLPAYFRLAYLVDGNSRANPASSAYGRDDCSWCSDAEAFSCRKHEPQVRQSPPNGMKWSSTFTLKGYKSMGFYKVNLNP